MREKLIGNAYLPSTFVRANVNIIKSTTPLAFTDYYHGYPDVNNHEVTGDRGDSENQFNYNLC